MVTTLPELLPQTGAAAIFPSNASSDNFFSHGATFSPATPNPEGIITISGLNPAKYYSFTIFASRNGVTNIRDAKYTFTGAGTEKMDTLNASNNTSRVAEVVSVSPSAEGIITMKVEAWISNNTSAEKFYFLGAMKMTISDTPTGLFTPKSTPAIEGFYNNGVLKIGDYTGRINVFNLTGSLAARRSIRIWLYSNEFAKRCLYSNNFKRQSQTFCQRIILCN